MLRSILLVTVVFFLEPLVLADHRVIVPNDLLDKYAENQNKLASYALTAELSQEWKLSLFGGQAWNDAKIADLRTDGTRVALRTVHWGDRPSGHPISKDNPQYRNQYWDGARSMDFNGGDSNAVGHLRIDDYPTERSIKALHHIPFAYILMGCYPHMNKRIDQILKEVADLSVNNELNEINGVDCYVVQAKAENGEYLIWIDPEHGFNVAQARIQVTKTIDKPVQGGPPFNQEISFDLENVRFKSFDGIWVATEADCRAKVLTKDILHQYKRHIKMTDLRLNPDHTALRSFVPDDIPNGTTIRKKAVSNISYTWRDSQLVPDISEDTLHLVNRMVEATIAEKGMNKVLAQLSRVQVYDPNRKNVDSSRFVPGGNPLAGPGDQDSKRNTMSVSDPNRVLSARESFTRGRNTSIHCGLYCVYSLLRFSGVQIDFRDLVRPAYLGSVKGSSIRELKRAVIDHGLFGIEVSNLTYRRLSTCSYPVILHVKQSLASKDYSHYVLYLGMKNGKVRLLDPSSSVKMVSFPELAARWDGKGMILSGRPIESSIVFSTWRDRLLVYIIVGVFVVLLLRLGVKRCGRTLTGMHGWKWLGLTGAQGIAFVVVASLCGVLYSSVNEECLLANTEATTALKKAHRRSFIPKIGHQKAQKMLNQGVSFVDARRRTDYNNGHLEGAISIPIDSNDIEIATATAGLDKSLPVVIYCQSAKCAYAEKMAIRLLEEGFLRVSVFKGGWVAWQAVNDKAIQKK